MDSQSPADRAKAGRDRLRAEKQQQERERKATQKAIAASLKRLRLNGDGHAAEPPPKPKAEPKGKAPDGEQKNKPASSTPSQATALAGLAMGEDVELFRTPGGDAYADIRIDGHRETWLVRSKGFKFWLRGEHFKRTRSAAGNEAMTSALDIIEAQAQFNGSVREGYLRVAERDGRIYINLADTRWRAIEIDTTGWRVIDEPPVRFVRKYGMLALPEPVRGGKVADLRKHIRVSDEGFALCVAGGDARARPLPGYRARGRARHGQVHHAEDAAQLGGPEHSTAAGDAGEHARQSTSPQ